MTYDNTHRDTRFRTALQRLNQQGRIRVYEHSVDINLRTAALMKALDGGEALFFPKVGGFSTPIIGNVLSCRENCEAAFGMGFREIRALIDQALGAPIPTERITNPPVQQHVASDKIDIGALLPALYHAPGDGGRYITAGIVVAKDPETGVYNASYHRLQLLGGDRLAIKLDYGRHLRLAFEHAQKLGKPLAVAVCIGVDLALYLTAATMGSQMPEAADELAVAGRLAGYPLPVAPALSQDLDVPAESEFVLEGAISPEDMALEGPFGEFVGFAAPAANAPVLHISAVTHRTNPIYHAINGYGRETITLRKYVLETSLLKVLRSAAPIVSDVEMSVGGMYRFHAVLQVSKTSIQHDGLQRNAICAAFGALKDLDLVTVVDDDINIRDSNDVEYAVATRMDASKDLFVLPGARGHEYVRIGNRGIRAKLGIDATVPYSDRARFKRISFATVDTREKYFHTDEGVLASLLGRTRGLWPR